MYLQILFLYFSDGTLEKSNVLKQKRSYYLYKMSMEHFWSEIPNHEEMIIRYPFEMETQSNIIASVNWTKAVFLSQGEPLSEPCKSWSIIIVGMLMAYALTWENPAFR